MFYECPIFIKHKEIDFSHYTVEDNTTMNVKLYVIAIHYKFL